MMELPPIILVENDELDVEAIKRAYKKTDLPYEMLSFQNGEEVVEYLQDPEKRSPWLILSDIKTPRMTGLELLAWLKVQPAWYRLPVVMISSSDMEVDVREAYHLGCAGYILKPINYLDFEIILRRCVNYLNINRF